MHARSLAFFVRILFAHVDKVQSDAMNNNESTAVDHDWCEFISAAQ